MLQTPWSIEPELLTECPFTGDVCWLLCTQCHLRKNTQQHPRNSGRELTTHGHKEEGRRSEQTSNLKYLCTRISLFILEYFQDHFSNKPGKPPTPMYKMLFRRAQCCVETSAVVRSHLVFHHLIPQEIRNQARVGWCERWAREELHSEKLMSTEGCQVNSSQKTGDVLKALWEENISAGPLLCRMYPHSGLWRLACAYTGHLGKSGQEDTHAVLHQWFLHIFTRGCCGSARPPWGRRRCVLTTHFPTCAVLSGWQALDEQIHEF